MSYKSGDVAALFSQLKVPTTESGKKLQNLFKEFHNLRENKYSCVKSQKQRSKKEFFISKHPFESNDGASKKTKKKRKFSDVNKSISELNAEDSTLKNQKLITVKTIPQKDESQVNITNSKVQNVTLKEKPFPRKKIKPLIKKGPTNRAFKPKTSVFKSSDFKSNDLKHKKICSNMDSDFKEYHSEKSASEEHLKSDPQSNEKELFQNRNQMVKNLKITKAKKQKKAHLHSSVLHYELNSNDNSQSNVPGVKHTTGEDNENFIRLTSTDCSEKKRERNADNEIFVGNLPLNVTKKDLVKLFRKFGNIVSVRISGIIPENPKLPLQVVERKHKYHKSLKSLKGYIEFQDKQNAMDALVLNGAFYKGNHIFVNLAAGGKNLCDDKLSIFIGNLPFVVADEAVWAAFSKCGPIIGIRIVRDRLTGLSKGFGYVKFSTLSAKQKALKLDKLDIEGRTIRIKEIESKIGKQKTPVKQFDSYKSKAFKLKKKQDGNSASRKSVKKIKKQLKLSQKRKQIASFLLNSK